MTPIARMHDKIKKEIESVRNETGAFVSFITIVWGEGDKGRTITEVTCTMGTSSKYEEKKDERTD
jgi:hypothetical protein